jgi:hypothetical protein
VDFFGLIETFSYYVGLAGSPPGQSANVGRKFREWCLIELVPATIQNPHSGVREGTTIALLMLDRDLGVVLAVVQIDRR